MPFPDVQLVAALSLGVVKIMLIDKYLAKVGNGTAIALRSEELRLLIHLALAVTAG
jgi:hypothetical protein